MTQFQQIPEAIGLYDPNFEKDACGVGFIVNIKGNATRKVLDDASNMVLSMAHRGALGADPLTGDGAGIMVAMPHSLFSKYATDNAWELPPKGSYAVGNVFLSQDTENRDRTKSAFEQLSHECGLQVLGWRTLVVNNTHIGQGAKLSEPHISQVFVVPLSGNTEQAKRRRTVLSFDQRLYLLNKIATHQFANKEDCFYLCSLSSKVIVYKGQLTPGQLFLYYAADLQHPLFTSHFAMVHTRFSTNTFPSWDRAQPLRYLAHNGEINTLRGNINNVRAREGLMVSDSYGVDLDKLYPIIDPEGSDSMGLDNCLEFLLMDGKRSLPEVMMMLVPEAWENNSLMESRRRAFYRWSSFLMEPWDGPGLFVFSDSRYVGAILDRNGLRPSRFYVTDDDTMVMASEVGVVRIAPHTIKQKGRLQPGKMLLVDCEKGVFYSDDDIKKEITGAHPFGLWLDKSVITMNHLASAIPEPKIVDNIYKGPRDPRLVAFNYTPEQLQRLIAPMVVDHKEALGSMGNDAPLACMSKTPRPMFDYFKQLFAQVTNPPIDPFREAIVMSLTCPIGPQGNLLEYSESQVHRLVLEHPVISLEELERIKNLSTIPGLEKWKVSIIDCTYPVQEGEDGLKQGLLRISKEVEAKISEGTKLVVLSDRNVSPDRLPMSSLLSVGAVHQYLVKIKKRLHIGLILESGEAREVHHMCLLLGFGVDAICPYLVYETMFQYKSEGRIFEDQPDISNDTIQKHYIQACDLGICKVMAKMGISTLSSYKGAQIFEAVGVGKEVMDMCFTTTSSRIGGVNFSTLAKEVIRQHQLAWPDRPFPGPQVLLDVGDYHFRTGGSDHINDPVSVANLQDAARTKNKEAYQKFSKAHDDQIRSCCLRGLLDFRTLDKNMQVPLEEVEPAANIVKRFCTGAMSYGSISEEAHKTLAVAMNRMGGKSNTGEGGEDRARYAPKTSGDSEKSAIKQVASGRFGVTIEYLGSAIEIQIKMAQGAKPGEGGELPGHKVSKSIASTRNSTPGVGLISPPPHHDIYSIEDLAQLIYDLKCANPRARISVKLVSEVGVGVVAAGVAKAHADHIVISGHDGGTGASSWTGIKHAGLPWELGIAETHQTLVLNNLRGRVVLQTDGHLRSGRDVVIASMLGADEFAFATAPLIVMGCTMMRKCHLNTCPVGIATQDPVLRKKFQGQPEHVVNYFFLLAQEIRTYMAKLGFRTMEEMTGRSDMLVMNDTVKSEKTKLLDLSQMLLPAFQIRMGVPTTPCQAQDHNISSRVDYHVITRVRHTIQNPEMPSHVELVINNSDRDFGTTLSYEVNRCTNGSGLPDGSIHIKLTGSAGQSCGAFLAKGITVELEGDSNDYVGKGLSGGRVIVYPAQYNSNFKPEENIIVGNVCLYGATSGECFFRGRAAERFCVRNSGALAVVEGVGDHGCEYMTGGKVVILGPTGRNFAAGMSGGLAYVLDDGSFKSRCNSSMCTLERVEDPTEQEWLKTTLERHIKYTGSSIATECLSRWPTILERFVKVFPNDLRRVLQEEAAERTKSKSRFLKKSMIATNVVDIEDSGPVDKVRGFMKYQRKADPYYPIEERIKGFEEINHRHNAPDLKVQAARCMDCGVPFCQTTATGCPLGNLIPVWNDLVFQGKHKEALLSLLATNSFPEFTGRVCPAPCEGACVLGINASAVSIKSIECAIIDRAFEEGWMVPQIPAQRTGKKIAVVGSGPSGMAAAQQLNFAGHYVTVYERAPEFGGLLRYGIPNMKLDKKVVRRRVDLMAKEGVTWIANANVGVDIDAHKLLEQYDAILLCNGATLPRNLPIKGRDLSGIHFAMEFLGQNPTGINAKGRHVLVIGGGDTGNDCIGTSVRQGALSVTSFEIMPQPPESRPSDNPWPQWPRIFRIDYGHAEVKQVFGEEPRRYSITTKEFMSDESGRVCGCRTVDVEWEKDPSSGRMQVKEKAGTEKTWVCDLVLLAMGFLGPEPTLGHNLKIATTPTSNYMTPTSQYKTSVDKVYAAGDARRGQSLVVHAINEGRQAAREMDADLMKGHTLLPVTGGVVKIHPKGAAA